MLFISPDGKSLWMYHNDNVESLDRYISEQVPRDCFSFAINMTPDQSRLYSLSSRLRLNPHKAASIPEFSMSQFERFNVIVDISLTSEGVIDSVKFVARLHDNHLEITFRPEELRAAPSIQQYVEEHKREYVKDPYHEGVKALLLTILGDIQGKMPEHPLFKGKNFDVMEGIDLCIYLFKVAQVVCKDAPESFLERCSSKKPSNLLQDAFVSVISEHTGLDPKEVRDILENRVKPDLGKEYGGYSPAAFENYIWDAYNRKEPAASRSLSS